MTQKMYLLGQNWDRMTNKHMFVVGAYFWVERMKGLSKNVRNTSQIMIYVDLWKLRYL